jgi:hypothetical protein
MGILNAFWNSFEDVFNNKKSFIIPLFMMAIAVIGLAVLFAAYSNYGVASAYPYYGYNQVTGQIGGGYNGYNMPGENLISVPILGYITYPQLAIAIVGVVYFAIIMIFSSLAITVQAYEIINTRSLSLQKILSKAVRKLPVAFASNVLVILLYLLTFIGIFLASAYVSSAVSSQALYNLLASFAVLLVEVVLYFILLVLIVYYSVFFYFVNTAIVAEDKGVINAIRRSVELSKNRKTKIFGAITMSTFINTIVDIAFFVPVLLLTFLNTGLLGGSLSYGLTLSSLSIMQSNIVMEFAVMIVATFFIFAWIGMVPMYLYTDISERIKSPRRAPASKQR